MDLNLHKLIETHPYRINESLSALVLVRTRVHFNIFKEIILKNFMPVSMIKYNLYSINYTVMLS